MARKKQTETGGVPAAVDSVFDDVVRFVEHKYGGTGRHVDGDDTVVLPLPSLALRYLLQNSGWPLGRMVQIVGAQASFKSTFAIEIARWHRLAGGRGVLFETESKPTPDLRNSVLGWDPNAVHVTNCSVMEEWQLLLTKMTTELQKKCELKNGPGRTVPVCFIVDSLMAAAARGSQEKVLSKGYASRQFSEEALLLNLYLQSYPQLLTGWPFSLVGVNHLKMGTTPQGLPQRNIPGGKAAKFRETFEIEMGTVGSPRQLADGVHVQIAMRTYKNSLGEWPKKIFVDFHWWFAEVPTESGETVHRQYSRFEWWKASIDMLMSLKEPVRTQAMQIVDLHEKSGGSRGKLFWSSALGVPSSDAMPAHDLGVLLETRTDLLEGLYKVLTIRPRKVFEPAVDRIAAIPGMEHIRDHAALADRLLQLQQQADAAATAQAGAIQNDSSDEAGE